MAPGKISTPWKTAFSVLSVHLGLRPNFIVSSYDNETRAENEQLPKKVPITYTTDVAKGTISIVWHEEPTNISYLSVRIEPVLSEGGGARAASVPETSNWLLVTYTSVKHVIMHGTSDCPLWLEMVRNEDGVVDARTCCADWKKDIDPSKPLTFLERREFAFIDVDTATVKPTATAMGYKTSQITILRQLLDVKTRESDQKIKKLEARVKMLEKLLAAEGHGDEQNEELMDSVEDEQNNTPGAMVLMPGEKSGLSQAPVKEENGKQTPQHAPETKKRQRIE